MKNLIVALLALVGTLFVTSAHAANCSSYPYTLTNGQTADATQVMANFNSILACGNSNLAHNGANSDITSLSGLITPLSVAQGGTGVTSLTGAIPNSYLADMVTGTLKGNNSGSTGVPLDLTSAQVETMVQPYLPFEFYTFVGGLTGNAWNLAAYQPSTALVLTTALSRCKVGTAATSSTTYTLKDNGSSIGTAVISAGSTTCTATITSSPYTVTAGHALTVVGPATADATAADVGITFGGTRN